MALPDFSFRALRQGGDQRRSAPTPDPVPKGDAYDAVPRRLRDDVRISASAYRVYAAVLSCCWGRARETVATNAKLAERSGSVSVDTVQRALSALERAGYLRRVPDPCVVAGRRICLLDPPEPV